MPQISFSAILGKLNSNSCLHILSVIADCTYVIDIGKKEFAHMWADICCLLLHSKVD